MTAIDKQGVKVLEQLFLQHTENGGSVLLTTHQDMFTSSDKLKKIRLGIKMLNNMLAIIRRELLIAFRRRADVFNPLWFFIIVITLFPLGIGQSQTC